MKTRSGVTLFVAIAGLVVLLAVAYVAFSIGQNTPSQADEAVSRAPAAANAAPLELDSADTGQDTLADQPKATAARRATRAPGRPRSTRTPRPTAESPVSPSDDALIVRDQKIYDRDGVLVYEGDINLAPTLARIEAGKRDRHPNDGSVFGNREGLLPRKPRGYYREWVVRTEGLREVGPQRVITGDGGEIYYTADHYASFIEIRRP
jgi:filamentous hemagglutinin